MIGDSKDFNEREYREALSVLEDDNVITLNGHASAPTIRFVNAWEKRTEDKRNYKSKSERIWALNVYKSVYVFIFL